jgi:hypothetical protein
VSPFTTGCQVIFTQLGPDGEALEHNKIFKTADGHYGTAMNPVQPHTVSRRARSCEDCHSSRKALGLGTGVYVSRLNGLDIPYELEQIVDEDGNQIQATSHIGARPFNKSELQKINRVNTCFACHSDSDEDFWEKAESTFGEARSNDAHRRILRNVLGKALTPATTADGP